jgi:hypothetical protein
MHRPAITELTLSEGDETGLRMRTVAQQAVYIEAPLGVFAFWGGVLMAARGYPSEYDWRYITISSLVYVSNHQAPTNDPRRRHHSGDDERPIILPGSVDDEASDDRRDDPSYIRDAILNANPSTGDLRSGKSLTDGV